MMNDLQRAYTDLAQEADSVVLPPPGTIRGRAVRRVRVRLAVAGVAVAVGGIVASTQWVLSADNAPVPGLAASPETTTSPSASSAPATSGPAVTASPSTESSVLATIPDRAFLQQADTNGDHPITDVGSENILPSLCGTTYVSSSLVRARRTKDMVYWAAKNPSPDAVPDGTYRQTITTYRPGGGSAFMDELRDAVAACPRETHDGLTSRNRLIDATARGDEALLIEVTTPTRDNEGNPTGGQDIRLISVVRIGDVVMVLYETGWERGWSADRTVVDRFTATAVLRVQAWIG